MSDHPFARLTPEQVLNALEGLGLDVDGRLSALSSYENRVYLAHRHDEPPVVAKFYRPHRWSEAQIREEHRFALQLAEQEVPMVAPLVLQGVDLELLELPIHHVQSLLNLFYVNKPDNRICSVFQTMLVIFNQINSTP